MIPMPNSGLADPVNQGLRVRGALVRFGRAGLGRLSGVQPSPGLTGELGL
jgi:hypothetical protein